jgi:DNA-binding transcriptional LysR family regulator
MELKHLRAFLAVAQELHFGRAASSLCISQPALSLQIRALEEEIGVRVFKRNRRTTSLTPAGLILIGEAREVLARSEQAFQRVRRAAVGQVGTLRLAFISTAAALLVPPLVKTFRELYPDVEVDLRNVLSADQVDQLLERRLDIGFLRTPINAPEAIHTTVLHREPFVLLLPASHPRATKRSLRLEDLQDSNFVMYTRKLASGFHDRILGIINSAGFSPHVVQEAGEMYTLISLVASGLGVAIAPASIQLHHTRGVVVRPLPNDLPLSEISLAANSSNLSPCTQLFIDLAKKTRFPTAE